MTPAIRFVASAGPMIGGGHLARAVALAEADWQAGSDLELSLVEGSPSPAQRERMHAAGARLVPLDAPITPGTVVVLDVPDPSPLAERWSPEGLAVFDDRESLRGRAGLVIQPSLPSWAGPAEADAVVAGFEYAPVARGVRRRRAASLTTPLLSGARPRLLVCFGGSDPDRVTERIVPALGQLDADLDVVIGAGYRGPIDGWRVNTDRDPPDLVERLATADLALLGAGTMKFEAACLGRPMLLLAAADDQRPVGPAFASTGAARYLGDGRTIDPDAVAEAARTLLADRPGLAALGSSAASLVDGAGADRIAAAVVRLVQPAASS
jgi:spore coat polysaccharide biosynthesis predicted glycosyltransferase SpsG